MGRDELINTTRAILAKAGFDISSALTMRGICFDVVARLDSRVLIVKVLSNVDAFSKENATEMKTLADALGATPLVVGERSSSGDLEAGIVYSRFNISIVSKETLADLLKKTREGMGMSLGTMAEIAGVSRRTIQMYEAGMGAMIDAALRIEESLGLPIIEPIDPFEFKNDERDKEHRDEHAPVDTFAVNQLCNLGFSVRPVVRSPFEAVSKNDKALMLTGFGTDDKKLAQRALVASDISRIVDKFSILIVERKHERDNIDSTAVVSNEELKKIDAPEELTDLVASRGVKK